MSVRWHSKFFLIEKNRVWAKYVKDETIKHTNCCHSVCTSMSAHLPHLSMFSRVYPQSQCIPARLSLCLLAHSTPLRPPQLSTNNMRTHNTPYMYTFTPNVSANPLCLPQYHQHLQLILHQLPHYHFVSFVTPMPAYNCRIISIIWFIWIWNLICILLLL